MEVVLVIIVALGLVFWVRSKMSRTESNRNLCHFDFEDETHAKWCIDFQTMRGSIPDLSLSFHVRRGGSAEWQFKWTKESYGREKASALEEISGRQAKHRKEIAKLERKLAEAKDDDAKLWQEMRSELGVPHNDDEEADTNPGPFAPPIADKIKAEHEQFAADIQKLQSELERLGTWTALPEYMIGPVETQYQRYLLHGDES